MSTLARSGRRGWRTVPLAVLGAVVVVAGAATAVRPDARAPAPGRASAYSLATPLAAMTATECATNLGCADAGRSGAVVDDGGDDHAALTGAVATVAPARGTVFLPAGTYVLSQPLYLPAGVTLAGAGLTRTTLRLSWASLANFSYNFLVAPAVSPAVSPAGSMATDVTVRDLTVDGGRRRVDCADGEYTGSCRPNHGGGVKAGSEWTVRQVRFTGMNYFKLWICGVDGVRVLDSRWDNLGGDVGAGGEDNVGGGCGASGVTIAGNSFHESIVGNVIDLTRASSVAVTRNSSEKNSVIFEGVTDSSITDSTVVGGDINVIPNGRYAASVDHGNYNPARITVARNTIDGGMWGINISYFNRDGAVNHPGGANVVAENRILRTSRMGIVVTSCDRGAKTMPDAIERNVITDTNSAGTPSYNAGCAKFEPVGIGLGAGSRDRITDNRVVDTRTPPLTAYAISVGDLGGGCPPSETVLSGNTAAGVGVDTVRYARPAGRAPTPAMVSACGGE